jgi:tRNA1(Val) A37 N6-methylase TrmN6
MAAQLTNRGNLLEPSAGNGRLLKFITQNNYTAIDVYELKQKYLDEIVESPVIHKHADDFIKTDIRQLYDNIIMNPPYIKIQDLSVEYRKYIKDSFSVLNAGMVDIYYAFIIKCLALLKIDGVMVSITPNSYLYNKSALGLRKYLFDNRYIKEIIDFKDKKVFADASVYCCITVFTKTEKTHIIYNNESIQYTALVKNYSLFNLNSGDGATLKSLCKIKNGVATLRDKIFIHSEKLFDEPCWKQITNGATIKYIIYPYDNGAIIKEFQFKIINPLTYEYLLSNKTELANRDKGAKMYPEWYAYGRSQSILYSNKKCIYIPCFIDPKMIEKCIFIHQSILHQSCLCVEPNDERDIDVIIQLILDNIEFIAQNSSKRGGGWINVSSRVLYDIPL